MNPLFALIALCAAAPALSAPLIVDHGRLYIPARVNGVVTEALLDSAAEASLIDPSLSEAANLGEGDAVEIKGSAGKASARFVSGVTVEVLNLTLKDREMVVTSLGDLSANLLKRQTRLILGRELFDAARVQINLRTRQINVVSAGSVPAGVKLLLTAQHGVEAIPVNVGGHTVLAELDFGNGSEPLISRALAHELGLKSVGRKFGGGIGGSIERDVVILPIVEIAGKRFHGLRATVDELLNAGQLNIGTSILAYFVVTTDFGKRAVYLAPAKGRKR